MATWGPIEFSGAEIAFIMAIFALVPPFMIAAIGSLVHAFVIQRRGEQVRLLPLFLKWWMWSTIGWIGAWFLGILFG